MANIDIEKKSGGSPWLWILGILLLLAVLAFIFWPDDTGRDEDEVAGVATTEQMAGTDDTYAADDRTGTMAQPVSSYVEWANNMSQNEMGLGHEFTKNGLMSMADALAAVAERAPNLNRAQFDSKLSTMRTKANAITNNWENVSHANKIKDAFQAGADVFAEIQSTSYPTMNQEVKNIRQAVSDMNVNTQTLEQKTKVKDVFRESADVIEKMARNVNS